ncbi:DUF362 domain-containing protein [Candidatus Bathyarchaeota archaeon]|nr:DUF362 domain-containing protein [Candidatus Bathyarchaeota archaeon]
MEKSRRSAETMVETSPTYSVFVSKCDDELNRVLNEGLEFVDWRQSARRDSVVFIKPNFTFPRYSEGITTRPEMLRCLLGMMKDRCHRVIVGESDGGNHSFTAEQSFEGHGMNAICKETGAELVSLSKLPSRFVESRVHSKRVKVQLPNLLLDDVDCFISAPVLKVHVMTGVSLGLKNLWGCYPDTMRCMHHQNLNSKLALIAESVKPKLVVIDGGYALDGHGPMWGTPTKKDLVLVSNNVVASDASGAALMGIPLDRAQHVLTAEAEGLGTTNLDKVRFNTDWRTYGMRFHVNKTLIDSISGLLFASDRIAKLVMASPLTPLVYGVAGILRSDEEKSLSSQLGNLYSG